MTTRTALIIFGTFKEGWWGLSPVAQSDFVSRVGAIAEAAGLEPVTGYRLTATPGAFLEVWEGENRPAVDRAVKELEVMGYTQYIDARWLIGERESQATKLRKPISRSSARKMGRG